MATRNWIDTGPSVRELAESMVSRVTPEKLGLPRESKLPLNGRLAVRFEIRPLRGSEVWMIVSSLETHDTDGNIWHITGVICHAEGRNVTWQVTSGQYDCRARKGWMEIEKPVDIKKL